MTTAGVNAETLTAARLLLTQMGISPADLIDPGVTAPTFAEVIPKVRAGLSPDTLRTYDTHFKPARSLGDRSLDDPSKADLEEKARAIQADARTIARRAVVPARSSISSAPPAASTATPRTMAGSASPTTPLANSPCPHASPRTATPYRPDN